MVTANKRTLREHFEDFHEKNPHVYAELVALAEERQAQFGITAKWNIKGIYEVARYTIMKTTEKEPKLNNNHTAFYSRKLMTEYPKFNNMFKLRKQREETDAA